MAKLGGKADPTVVKMAYAEALGNTPLDQSKNYQTMVDMHKELMGDIEAQAKALKVNRAVDELAFETAMSIFDTPLAAQVIDSDYNMMYSEVEAQRRAWEDSKGFKDDDKGLADWNRKNQQIIQRYEGNQQDLIDLKTAIDGKVYDVKGMSKSDIGLMTNIANYTGNKNGKSGIYNEKATEYMKNNPDATAEEMWMSLGIEDDSQGIVVKYHDPATGEYTYVSRVLDENGVGVIASAKSGDLKNRFKLKADNSLTEVQKAITNVGNNAKNTTKGWENFSNDYRNQLDGIIEDGSVENANTLNYLMKNKVGGQEQSFADALEAGKVKQTPEILAVLKNQEGYKDDGDGVIDRGDFDTAENYQKVVRSILNGELDKQDPGSTKEMYLDFMDDELKRVHDLYKKVETPKGPTDTGLFKKDEKIRLGSQKSWGKQVEYNASEANSYVEDIKAGNKFTFDGYHLDFDPETGGWTATRASGKDAGTQTKYDDTDQMVRNIFQTNDPRFDNLKTEYEPKVDPQTGEIEEDTTIQWVAKPESYKGLFMLEEDLGLNELKKLLPSGYTFKTRGILGIDNVEIFDEQDNSLGTYGFDFSKAKNATAQAKVFWNKFGPDGLNVLDTTGYYWDADNNTFMENTGL
jgi:hypothetical protein